MLKRFLLKNYKNFKDELCINFEDIADYQFSTDCIENGIIRKMLIYGQNATGKTNLGKALMDIYSTIFGGLRHMDNEIFLNADSSEESAVFSYIFQFDDKELVYTYARLSNQELQYEELIIDGTTIFKCNFDVQEYLFDNLKDINAETANTERYLQSLDSTEPILPFLRWLINNVALDNNSILIRLADYAKKMTMITVGNTLMFPSKRTKAVFYTLLEMQEKLQDLEDFLNAMGIECRLALKKLPDGQRELYFAQEKLIPFYENASSGTLALVDLYCGLVPDVQGASFIYLDEFDAFYHYEMAEKVIQFFKKRYPKCQVVMTSHNTNLMTNRLMRPDCVFILSKTGTLTALCNATQRELKEGHNLEKMYISGEFERYE